MKNFILVISLCIGYVVFGQELPTVTPPSPEASALAKFTDIPVSHYTGIANTNIPIYTIAQKGISIPITLSYHGRGVQVAEIAPRTGTGWSLQYGGSISRQIRGKADESSNAGYLSNRADFMNYATDLSTRERVATNEPNYDNDQGYDFYPDQFSFSTAGSSGKFILDYSNGKPILQNFDDVKITYTREEGFTGRIDSFKVIDPAGNTFYYGISKDGLRKAQDSQTSSGKSVYINRVVDDPISASDINAYSSWKLMDIETIYGELISYNYESIGTTYYRKAYDKGDSSNITNSGSNMYVLDKISSRLSIINNYEYQLKEIVYNKGSIRFDKQSDLRDDYNGYALDKISIYDYTEDLVKAYQLNYIYTTSTDQNNLLYYFKYPEFKKSFKRLFLSSIEQEGRNGEKLSPYSFTYNPIVLPSRYSTAKDYWGYYNGANNGPFSNIVNYGNYTIDRRVNSEKSEAGLLTQITYPTGGSTTFTYGDNIGMPPSYMSKVMIPEINPASEPVSDTGLNSGLYPDLPESGSGSSSSSSSEIELIISKKDFEWDTITGYKPLTITFPALTNPSASHTYKVFCTHFRDVDGDPDIPDCIFDIVMSSVNRNGFIGYGALQDGEIRTFRETTKEIRISPKSIGNSDLHALDRYDFRIIFSSGKKSDADSHSDFEFEPNSAPLYAGGKRIQRITYTTENTVRTKEFEYVATDLNITSGNIIGLPSFMGISPIDSNFLILDYYYASDSAFGMFQPNTVGYSQVKEYNGTKLDNIGMTQYVFTNMSDSGGDYYEFPYHPPTDNEWLRGKNIRTKIFKKKEDGQYELLKEVHNKYSYANTIYQNSFENVMSTTGNFVFTPVAERYNWNQSSTTSTYTKSNTLFRLPLFMRQPKPKAEMPLNFVPGYRIYHATGGTLKLHSSTETNYLHGEVFTSQTNYGYDYDNHYQLANSERITSNGTTLKTENTYPAVGSSLRDDNRMTPINTKVFEDNQQLSEQHTIYKRFDNGIDLPEIIQSAKGSADLENRITYHKYDTKGNPLEVSMADGIHIIYIWGYDDQHPIAKITNATYTGMPAAVTTLINQLKTASDTDTTVANEITMRSLVNQLRDHDYFEDAEITSYTYDPLIGVTSQTDPRGYTMTYHYDAFNRLESVKNEDGKMISENKYSYKK